MPVPSMPVLIEVGRGCANGRRWSAELKRVLEPECGGDVGNASPDLLSDLTDLQEYLEGLF